MILPDYSKCDQLNLLLLQMGVLEIPILPEAKFVHTSIETQYVEVANTTQLNFYKKMKLNAIPITPADIKISNQKLIEINGIKCCVYIKNQRSGVDLTTMTSTYRFHLCNCHTIQEMIREGRGDRYVATSRDDGLFVVCPQGWGYGEPKEYEIALELCSNCRNILVSLHMYEYPFCLKAFYARYQPDLPKTFKRPEQVKVTSQYTPNQREIANEYKRRAGYVCQLCSVDCTNHPECLHLHHVDGDGQNNKPQNLRVFCILCHMAQYQHGHMKRLDYAKEIKILEKMRKEQGIITLTTPKTV